VSNELQSGEYKVLFIDNISTLAGAAMGKDPTSWQVMDRWFNTLGRQGITVIFVHHAGKDGRQRGSSSKENNAHCVVKLEKRPSDPSSVLSLNMTITKNRHGAERDFQPFHLRMAHPDQPGERWSTSPIPIVSSSKGKSSENDDALILDEALKLYELGYTDKQVAEELGLSRSSLLRKFKNR
jgi:putative DNA primase/helicase